MSEVVSCFAIRFKSNPNTYVHIPVQKDFSGGDFLFRDAYDCTFEEKTTFEIWDAACAALNKCPHYMIGSVVEDPQNFLEVVSIVTTITAVW